MYELSGVTKQYRRGKDTVHALAGVDLTIGEGDRLVIKGPTGGGKSTLLQMLGGLDRPTAGSVKLDGTDLARLGEAKLTAVRGRSIGFVFQSFNLIPTLSAQENVETALVPLGTKAGSDATARPRPCAPSDWGSASTMSPRRCPAVSSSASPSRGRSSNSRRCCWPTNRPAISTSPCATRSWTFSKGSGRSTG